MIIEVNASTLHAAAIIHSDAWKSSHTHICSAEFIALHTPERQEKYLQREIAAGKQLYMLIENEPVGIVSVMGALIENLYVITDKQRKGYGTALLKYAITKCNDIPRLWVLDSNIGAVSLYTKLGFCPTGNKQRYSDTISEIEMSLLM